MKRGIVILMCMVGLMASCRKVVGPTEVRVEDPVRHYLPLLCGEELRMLWKIYNDGPSPLVIEDIQPDCRAIELMSAVPKVVPVGDSVVMEYRFMTDVNINLVNHTIRIFGNIEPEGETDLCFDVHIVPPTVDHADYEEKYYLRRLADHANDPETHMRLYYTDEMTIEEVLGWY